MDFDLSTREGRMAWVQYDTHRLYLAEQRRKQEQAAKQREIIVNMNSDKIAKAEADIAFWKERVNDLYALLDIAEANLASAMVGGKDQLKAMEKTMSLKSKIHSAEIRLAKAKADKENAVQIIMP